MTLFTQMGNSVPTTERPIRIRGDSNSIRDRPSRLDGKRIEGPLVQCRPLNVSPARKGWGLESRRRNARTALCGSQPVPPYSPFSRDRGMSVHHPLPATPNPDSGQLETPPVEDRTIPSGIKPIKARRADR